RDARAAWLSSLLLALSWGGDKKIGAARTSANSNPRAPFITQSSPRHYVSFVLQSSSGQAPMRDLDKALADTERGKPRPKRRYQRKKRNCAHFS
ncbi:MAG: hypothetical protein P8Y67_13765, partial [Alphaproteobacteria bacterium]